MIDRAALLGELLEDPSRAALVPRGEAVALLVELARVAKALELLAVPFPTSAPAEDAGVPLSVDEVMQLTGLSRRGVFARSRRPDWRPYAVRQGRKTLVFRPAIRQFVARHP